VLDREIGSRILEVDELTADAVAVDEASLWERLAERTILPTLFGWAGKSGLTILDQGLISGSNFMISVLLARWLTPDQYGSYAVAFGIFVLLSLIYGALVLEQMSVFGGSTYRSSLRQYLRSLLGIHFGIGVAIVSVLGSFTYIEYRLAQPGGLPGALLGVTVASPCVLLLWLTRRAYYLEMAPAKAAAGAVVYCALMLAGISWFNRAGLLSPLTAFLLIAASALVAALLLLFRLKTDLLSHTAGPALRQAWSKHWHYGRWALASCIASWIPAYIYYPLLSSFSGPAQSGQLKALMNFFSPLDQTLGALSMLFLPFAAGVQAERGSVGLKTATRNITLLAVAGALLYWSLVIPFKLRLFHLLYTGKYDSVVHLLPILAIGSIFWTAAYGPAIGLRAMESPHSVFAAYGAATVGSLLVGVPAAKVFGLRGAVWGSNLADVASFALMLMLLRKRLRRNTALKTSQHV